MKISVLIITKNEQDVIKKCIESAKWADEVLVVDSFGTDSTVQIAQLLGAKVLQRQWGGYGDQRNFGISHCIGDWVLVLDADETISDKLRDEVLKLKINDYSAYQIPRRFYFLGKLMRWGGVYPDMQKRLFKKNKAFYDNSPLHEKLIVSGKVARLKNPINHYSYRTISSYFDKFNNYSSLDALKRKDKNESASVFQFIRFPFSFFVRYVLRLGFLDGYNGLLWAIFSSFYEVAKFAKLREIRLKEKMNESKS
ncbi:MAG: glycosyltransferase family 2 protein [Endomicrobiales bacterium]|nr:glycosyltransferase family 2 protein [Endomicrobiales bacterium]